MTLGNHCTIEKVRLSMHDIASFVALTTSTLFLNSKSTFIMSIRPDARRWFLSKYEATKNKICTSKYFLPEESWPKKPVWWIQVPSHAIDANLYDHVNLICQVAPLENNFHYLKVPVKYFHEHLDNFHKIGGEIDLYLSAEPNTLFMEIRGVDKLNFSKFLVSPSAKKSARTPEDIFLMNG